MTIDQRLLSLYTLAFAPLGGDTLISEIDSLTEEDVTADVISAEIAYVGHFTTEGMKRFEEFFSDEAANRSPSEGGPGDQDLSDGAKTYAAGAYFFDVFLKRLSFMSEALSKMSNLNSDSHNVSDVVTEYQKAAADNVRPENPGRLSKLLDLSLNAKWEIPSLPNAKPKKSDRVGFHEVTTVILPEKEAATGQEPIRTAVSRRRARNPTGFNKFTFRASDLGLSEGDLEDSTSQDFHVPTSASSHAGRDSRASSVLEISHDISSCGSSDMLNPFGRACGARSSSLVNFPCISERKEIQDADADPQWGVDEARRSRRHVRIRARKATGAPALMKETSLQLRDMLDGVEMASTEELEALNKASITAVNTTRNSRNSKADIYSDIIIQ